MSNVIQRDHELICRGCGCVLGEVEETPHDKPTIKTPASIDMFLLGGAIDKSLKFANKISSTYYEEDIVRKLSFITRKYGIPDRFVWDVYNNLKKKKNGFRSEIEPIKELIKILSKDENYYYNKKLREIKKRYEELSHC